MEHVYTSYFGLTEPPFNITPDPMFLYRSGSHREALAQLSYGITARKGFVVLTGEVGTGKTTLIHSLLRELGEDCHTALIFSVIADPNDLLRWVCEEFRLIEPKEVRHGIHDYLVLLNEFLLEKYRRGENCALVVDEAQNLSSGVLESIRLLSNFETSKDKLLQIILVGQPELSVRLNSQDLRQLKQRIALRYELRPLDFSQCEEYIATRMKVAGGELNIFTSDAVDAIYRYSRGTPRLINVLCDNALLTGYALAKKQIDRSIIEEVSRDLSLSCEGLGKFSLAMTGRRPNGAPSESRPPPPSRFPEKNFRVHDARTVNGEGPVSAERLEAVRSALIEAMGPMASIVLEERIRRMGHSAGTVPESEWTILIESVSEEILESSMRKRFQQSCG